MNYTINLILSFQDFRTEGSRFNPSGLKASLKKLTKLKGAYIHLPQQEMHERDLDGALAEVLSHMGSLVALSLTNVSGNCIEIGDQICKMADLAYLSISCSNLNEYFIGVLPPVFRRGRLLIAPIL